MESIEWNAKKGVFIDKRADFFSQCGGEADVGWLLTFYVLTTILCKSPAKVSSFLLQILSQETCSWWRKENLAPEFRAWVIS